MTTRDKKLMVVIVPGVLFVAWRIVAALSGGTSAPAAAQAAVPAVATPLPPVAAAPSPAKRNERLDHLLDNRTQLPWGRDPFALEGAARPTTAPAAASEISAPDWTLTGISWSGKRPIAILGGRVVMEGDRIDDRYTVVSISHDDVRVRDADNEHRFILGLSGVETRRLGGSR